MVHFDSYRDSIQTRSVRNWDRFPFPVGIQHVFETNLNGQGFPNPMAESWEMKFENEMRILRWLEFRLAQLAFQRRLERFLGYIRLLGSFMCKLLHNCVPYQVQFPCWQYPSQSYSNHRCSWPTLADPRRIAQAPS